MKTCFGAFFNNSGLLILVVLASLNLSGCWTSEKALFDDSSLVNPFRTSEAFIFGDVGEETLLIKKTGNTFELESRDGITQAVGFVSIDFSIEGRDLSFYFSVSPEKKSSGPPYTYSVFALDSNQGIYLCPALNPNNTSKVNSKSELELAATTLLNEVRDDIASVCDTEGQIRSVTHKNMASIRGAILERWADEAALFKLSDADIAELSKELDAKAPVEKPKPVPVSHIKSDENAIFYECAGRSLAFNSDIPDRFCQCLNDQALSKMSARDWSIYSKDYLAFNRLDNDMDRSTPYKEKLAFINSDCMTCKERNYRGCIRDDRSSASTENINNLVSNIGYGQFDLITKDDVYKIVFTHLVKAYSNACSDNVPKPRNRITFIERTEYSGYSSLRDLGYMHVEESINPAFDRYESQLANSLAVDVVRDTIESVNRGNLPLGGFSLGIQKLQTMKQLDQILGAVCDKNSRLSRVYTNAVRFERNLPAIVPNGKIERKSTRHVIDRGRIQDVANRYISEDMARRPGSPLKCKYDWADIKSPPAIQSKVNKSYMIDFVGTHKTYIADLNGTRVHIALWPEKPAGSLIKDKVFINAAAYFPSAQCVLPAELKIFRQNYMQLKIDSGGGMASCSEKLSLSRLIEDGILIHKENTKDISWKMFQTNFLERKLESCGKATMPLRASKISSEAIAAMKADNDLRFQNYPDDPMRKDETFWKMLNE